MARWKARAEFLLSVIELLFLSLTVEALQGKCVKTRSLQERVGHLEPRFQEERVVPCQYIDIIRKAIDCGTILPLRFFYIMKLCSRLSSFIVEIVQKTTNLGNFPHFEEVRGGVEP